MQKNYERKPQISSINYYAAALSGDLQAIIALSDDLQALIWIHKNYPRFWEQKDRDGKTPIHYAVQPGNLEVLTWIHKNYPQFWEQKDRDGKTPIHYAVQSGNLAVLTWIDKNYPQFWKQKDRRGRTPIHYAALSGNPDVFAWINENHPEFLQQKDDFGNRPIEYAAMSENPLALNKALSFEKNPQVWIISCSEVWYSIKDTLLKALETNYSLMVVKVKDSYNEILNRRPEWEAVQQCLQRNRYIQPSQREFQVLMQGVSQQTGSLFAINLQMQELSTFVDSGNNSFNISPKISIHNEISSYDQGKSRALKYLNDCIERLKPSKKENNYMFFGMLPLHGFLKDSNNKIKALCDLKKIILNTSDNLGMLISTWERQHGQTLAEHRSLFSEFFPTEMTETELCLQNIKNMLNINVETEQLRAQDDSPKL